MTSNQLPSFERLIHGNLQSLYDNLSDLKNNRSKYISSQQIYQLYDQFLTILHELSLTRKDEELKGIKIPTPNSNDLIIDDIWQLLSLCFVTCGLIKFAPATYSSLSTVYKLLEHLKEARAYTYDDIKSIKGRLDEIKKIILTSGSDPDCEDSTHKSEESLLLRNKLNKCLALYKELELTFENIPYDLIPVYDSLISIRKSLLKYLTETSTVLSTESLNETIAGLRNDIKEVALKRNNEGHFISENATEKQLQSTQIVLNGLLDDCNDLVQDLSIQKATDNLTNLFEVISLQDENSKDVLQRYKSLYDKLIDLKLKLENLLVTRRWTMRETDLYTFQKLVKQIDDERVPLSKNIIHDNKDVRKLEVLILYLLRRCYALIYKLLESSEPVSESLQPIHNQLSTVRRCLLELKRIDGLNTLRDLYPFQFKLGSLDNLRKDGKFIVNNQIPEGQGALNTLLAECFDIVHELKIELEEKEEQRNSFDGGGHVTDEEDIKSDDEVELKRNRYVGFNEADYDQDSETDYDLSGVSDSEYEGNDYY